MGMTCTLYTLTPAAFAAAMDGDLEAFDTGEERLDLDKAWHAISYLVTGDASMDFLNGDVQLPEIAEQCEAHAPTSVAALNTYLSGTTSEALLSGFSADAFAEIGIYPDAWDETGSAFVRPHLEAFIRFVESTARKGLGLFSVIA